MTARVVVAIATFCALAGACSSAPVAKTGEQVSDGRDGQEGATWSPTDPVACAEMWALSAEGAPEGVSALLAQWAETKAERMHQTVGGFQVLLVGPDSNEAVLVSLTRDTDTWKVVEASIVKTSYLWPQRGNTN